MLALSAIYIVVQRVLRELAGVVALRSAVLALAVTLARARAAPD